MNQSSSFEVWRSFAMGGHFSSETSLVVCYSGRCSHAFPLRVSTDAARAASAAAMGNAIVATVVGYTTQLTREAWMLWVGYEIDIWTVLSDGQMGNG